MYPEVIDSIRVVGTSVAGSSQSFFSKRKKNQRIDFKDNDCIYYLEKGSVSFYRTDTHVLNLSLSAPAIIGLVQLKSKNHTHYFRCEGNCEMWIIKNSDAISLFNKLSLWEHAFNIISNSLHIYFHRDSMTNQKNVKNIVIEHLKYIWSMSDEERKSTSIYKFILSRNHVSRSSVHKVIAELIHDGIVESTRGKLIKLDINQ